MSNNRLLAKIADIPLISLLLRLKGNPKALILTETLWAIPKTLLLPFTTVYMYALGVSKTQIGLALSITMVLRVFFAVTAGIFTDKLGRKKSTMLSDFITWVIPSIIWAVAQNYWYFLIAMAFNSFDIGLVSWNSFWIEDAEPRDIIGISNWFVITGMVSVLFSPLSAFLLGHFSLIPVVRGLYILFAVLVVIRIVLLGRFTHETELGLQRMEETKHQSPWEMLKEYRHLLPVIGKSPGILRTLAMMVIMYVTTMVNDNFFSLFATQTLLLPEQMLAYLPILRALVLMAFLFGIQHVLERLPFKLSTVTGFIIYLIGQGVVVFSPQLLSLFSIPPVWILVAYTLAEAIAFGILNSRKEKMMAHYMNFEERARTNSVLTAMMLAFAIPFGSIAGNLSQANGAYPFLLNGAIFLLGLFMILLFQGDLEQDPPTA